MINSPEYHVYFAVTGFGDDPDVVTRIMGMAPTRAWVRGEPNGRGKQTHSRWFVQSRLPLSASIEAHFDDLFSQLSDREKEIQAVASRFPAHVAVATYTDAANLAFQLPAEIVRRVAAIGLSIDFDLYSLGP